jgi:hypothetical protein
VVEVLAFSLQNLPEVAIAMVGLLMTKIMATGQGPCEGAHQEGVSLIKLLEAGLHHRKVYKNILY